jgi:hypothetical protein
MDPKLVKMTVGCGICHINTKHMYTPNGVLTQENQHVTAWPRIIQLLSLNLVMSDQHPRNSSPDNSDGTRSFFFSFVIYCKQNPGN